jgi:hypothetical protein
MALMKEAFYSFETGTGMYGATFQKAETFVYDAERT